MNRTVLDIECSVSKTVKYDYSLSLCLNLQAELSRTLWRFPSLLRFLFETLLPCLFQTQLSSFGICVGLNSVY